MERRDIQELAKRVGQQIQKVIVGGDETLELMLCAMIARGHVLLDIEPKGAEQVKQADPNAVLIFIMPPSMEVLEQRLRGRGDTPEDQITIRMERANWEMEQKSWYDYVVVNDSVERCAEEILNIIAEKADE